MSFFVLHFLFIYIWYRMFINHTVNSTLLLNHFQYMLCIHIISLWWKGMCTISKWALFVLLQLIQSSQIFQNHRGCKYRASPRSNHHWGRWWRGNAGSGGESVFFCINSNGRSSFPDGIDNHQLIDAKGRINNWKYDSMELMNWFLQMQVRSGPVHRFHTLVGEFIFRIPSFEIS